MADWTEKLYEYVTQHIENYAYQRVDYLGVDIAAGETREPLFKLYYREGYARTLSEGQQPSLIGLLQERKLPDTGRGHQRPPALPL